MGVISIITSALSAFGIVGNILGKWLDKKKLEADGKVIIQQARIDLQKSQLEGQAKLAQQGQLGDIEYDLNAQDIMKTSWKDEWLTLLLSIPFIMCFIPYTQKIVLDGFAVLSTTPEWYQYCFIGIVVASFGLRSWFRKHGIKK